MSEVRMVYIGLKQIDKIRLGKRIIAYHVTVHEHFLQTALKFMH